MSSQFYKMEKKQKVYKLSETVSAWCSLFAFSDILICLFVEIILHHMFN